MSEIRCNRCGRIIVFGDMHNKEDYVLIQKEWGYFSRKDDRRMSFGDPRDDAAAIQGTYISRGQI